MGQIESGKPETKTGIQDGIIHGRIDLKGRMCNHCGHETYCVRIYDASPPEVGDDTLDLNRTILKGVEFLGIGCGCYAKFHRQVAHIMDRMKETK